MLAYLVIREGSKWTDVFRLVPGRTVTIGRAGTNQIVIKDERASRNHAEIFITRGQWTLRDLESRNGTIVGSKQVRGDYPLTPGEVIRIAHCQLAYVQDLSKAFPDTPGEGPPRRIPERCRRDCHRHAAPFARPAKSATPTCSLPASPPPSRIAGAKPASSAPAAESSKHPKVGQAATKLCKLAFELASQPDIAAVAHLALNGLFDSTQVDAGAVLLLPQGKEAAEVTTAELNVVASRTDVEPSYHRLSAFLAVTVLRDGEAVLARNVEGDSNLGSRDSKGEIHSTSVICAPIRQDRKVVGLIHTYSTQTNRVRRPRRFGIHAGRGR